MTNNMLQDEVNLILETMTKHDEANVPSTHSTVGDKANEIDNMCNNSSSEFNLDKMMDVDQAVFKAPL